MTLADTMRVPIYDNVKEISLLSGSSDGTDFNYMDRGGEYIRVRVDQLWFWTEEWQAGEQQVNDYINEGNVQSFDSMEEFLRTLQE